ncbi:MAG: TetR/AcrR family transcriptional regulator [Alphaproteobacteria bacterium]|nr:TetR/AcrR family transcriptional regulator [Alphaproteobacteria bacterium]MBU1515671.1 TetR/AcrR family transcriptional regulator [Alphaproteobacteria bacterium]MBU2094930.1 TetR/AcrR family transcriptional regulator [Alphaproteobacteria bacterium]MBU2150962.1 TetR/AcrR family transcriptional regulator [Alphaproteobacteria bacterium]MBU2305939.1 TetR/AcrR family transcriptional regulator [Alphaproteobacteria bacterium]
MTSAAPPQPEPEVADGRRRRGLDNRARIVAAMIEMVRAEEIAPSAERVAARADVGLRTVFRHFQDMDSLYREMAMAIEREIRVIIDQPLESTRGPARVIELIARRARAFEIMSPFRRASEAFRHRSKFLGTDYARLVTKLREILERELPPEVARDPMKLEGLDLLLSYEAWARLRRDQGLSVDQAKAVLESAARALIA